MRPRILAIVSTASIPKPAPDELESTVNPTVPGVPFGRLSPRKRGPYSTPNHSYGRPLGFVGDGEAVGVKGQLDLGLAHGFLQMRRHA